MKITVRKMPFGEVKTLRKPEHRDPRVSLLPLRWLMKILGKKDLQETDFSYRFVGIDRMPEEPCLILMNHSSWIDLEIVSHILCPTPFSIVCTSDGFVGKEWLMRSLGCIPTNKFVTDPKLIPDIGFALRKNKTHVLMYPEASYSFDGCATALPRRFGTLLRMLKAPVVMIRTYGAFSRDPLYNMLQKRKVRVSADVELLFSKEQLASLTTEQIDERLDQVFTFDHFAWQAGNRIAIDEPFRADGLQRILYKCPYCGREGQTVGKGTEWSCLACGKKLTLDPYGRLCAEEGQPPIDHIPAWYRWEREEVGKEIADGRYRLDCHVKILVLRDFKAVYDIGGGRLTHSAEGFRLVSDDGALDYSQKPNASYSLYSDYYWYEIGDMVCIGNNDMLYYCFPDDANIPVAKVRLAAEELYKLAAANRRMKPAQTD